MSSKLFKIILLPIILAILIFESIFQILAFTNSNLTKKPILFFNPYCDQAYWNYQKQDKINNNSYEYHPILSLTNKNNPIPINFTEATNNTINDSKTIFYGSSFIDHSLFKRNFSKNINYAVKSYGLDQIFQSYILTKHKHYGDTIIIGFLLEDLDRVLFYSRDYEKLRFKKKDGKFLMVNTPIKLDKTIDFNFYFYSYHFLKSIFFLINNDFDYKKSKCSILFKKDLFEFFIEEIQKNTKKYNQNLIFITFNFKEDFKNDFNWRYNFIKEILKNRNIQHIDTKKIILKHKKENKRNIEYYFSKKDFHYNKIANEIISEEVKNFIKQYK